MRDVHVALVADRRFRHGCAVAIRSAAANLGPDARLVAWVLHSGTSQTDLDKMAAQPGVDEGRVEVRFVQVPLERLEGVRTMRFINHLAFARLLLPILLPDDVRRCIYLDTDMVVETDIQRLFDADLEGSPAGAVPEPDQDFGREQLAKLGAETRTYFNTGLMVIDLDMWRAEDLGQQVLEFCIREQPDFVDQGGLNAVIGDRFTTLDSRWNSWATQTTSFEDRILHFTGHPKPWDLGYQGPHRNEFFEYLDETGFSGWRPPTWMGLAPVFNAARARIPHWPSVKRELVKRLRG